MMIVSLRHDDQNSSSANPSVPKTLMRRIKRKKMLRKSVQTRVSDFQADPKPFYPYSRNVNGDGYCLIPIPEVHGDGSSNKFKRKDGSPLENVVPSEITGRAGSAECFVF